MSLAILVVEDNPMARQALCRVVRESFSDVDRIDEASSLAGAREQIAALAPRHHRLVLVDLDMEDGQGMALLAELRDSAALRVATTLYADADSLVPALQLGVRGYLLKEDRFETLVEELQKIARGQPVLSPAIARRILAHLRGDGGRGTAAVGLGGREAEVLAQLAKGFTPREIAALMGIAWQDVNVHVARIYEALRRSPPVQRPPVR